MDQRQPLGREKQGEPAELLENLSDTAAQQSTNEQVNQAGDRWPINQHTEQSAEDHELQGAKEQVRQEGWERVELLQLAGSLFGEVVWKKFVLVALFRQQNLWTGKKMRN